MNRKILFVVVLGLALALFACDKDDNDDNGNGYNGDYDVEDSVDKVDNNDTVITDGDTETASDNAEEEAVAEEEQEMEAPEGTVMAEYVEPFATLGNEFKIASAEYIAGYISPDGTKIALTKAGFKGLYIYNVATGSMTTISEEPMAGYKPVWSLDSSRIAYRVPGQQGHEIPLLAADISGNPVAPFLSARNNQWVSVNAAEQIELISKLNDGKLSRVVLSPQINDKFFAPAFSPNGAFVLYSGLETGIYVYRVSDGLKVFIGDGSNPSFSADGRYLVFERTKDDAHDITGSDIYITDLNSPNFRTCKLTDTPNRIELMPTMAAGKIVFAAQDGIYIAEVVF